MTADTVEREESAPGRYFLAFLRWHGIQPETIEAAGERWPGRVGYEYRFWIQDRLREFAAAHPEAMVDGTSISPIWDHAAWGDFLDAASPRGEA